MHVGVRLCVRERRMLRRSIPQVGSRIPWSREVTAWAKVDSSVSRLCDNELWELEYTKSIAFQRVVSDIVLFWGQEQ